MADNDYQEFIFVRAYDGFSVVVEPDWPDHISIRQGRNFEQEPGEEQFLNLDEAKALRKALKQAIRVAEATG